MTRITTKISFRGRDLEVSRDARDIEIHPESGGRGSEHRGSWPLNLPRAGNPIFDPTMGRRLDSDGSLRLSRNLADYEFVKSASLDHDMGGLFKGLLKYWEGSAHGVESNAEYDVSRLPSGEQWPGIPEAEALTYERTDLTSADAGDVNVTFLRRDGKKVQYAMSTEEAENLGLLNDGLPASPDDLSGISFFMKKKDAATAPILGAMRLFAGETTPRGALRHSPLDSFRAKSASILERTPEDRKAAAQSEIDAAFAKVEGNDRQKIGSLLGPELSRIEKQYVPSDLQIKKKAPEELKEEKNAARENSAITSLRACGVWTPEIDEAVIDFRDFNGTTKRIREAIFTAEGSAKKGDLIAAYNHLRGLLFEISRNKHFATATGIRPDEISSGAGTRVKYHGLAWDGTAWRLRERTSAIQADNIVLSGSAIVHEHKFYPRRNYGIAEDGQWDTQALNQAIKLNEALQDPDSGVNAASIEVGGNISPAFLFELAKKAPDVEVLYCLKLPSGAEVVFRIKEGGAGRPSLKRWPDIKSLAPDEQVVVDGLRKVIQNGKLLKDGVLQNDFLKLTDVPEGIRSRFAAAAGPDGAINPLKIGNLETFKVWEDLLYKKRLNYFERKSALLPVPRSSVHLETPVTDEAVDRYIAEAERAIAEGPVHTQRQYKLTDPTLRARARAEFKRRLVEIQSYESKRASSPEERSDRDKRIALGYKGPDGGYFLDTTHIYQDVLKGMKEDAKKTAGQGRAAGPLPFGLTQELPARSYDKAPTIMNAPEILQALLQTDSKFAKDTHFMRIVYPENIVPDVGEQVVNAKTYDTSDAESLAKTRDDLHKRNLGYLNNLRKEVALLKDPEAMAKLSEPELKALRTLEGLLAMGKRKIAAVESALDAVRTERDAKFKESDGKIDGDSTMAARDKGRAKGKARGVISQEYNDKIRKAEESVLKAYEEVLGTARYRKLFAYVDKEWDSDEIKFIYTVDSKGTIKMVQEDLKPGSERPAHSQLAAGHNVYAAGQVWIKGRPVLGSDGKYHIQINAIDDGSGHYRPGTFDMLPYAQSVFTAAGFDTSKTEFKHAPLPFIPLGEDFDAPKTADVRVP